MTSIYIAGKISGEDEERVAAKFMEAHLDLEFNWDVIFNPLDQIQKLNERRIKYGQQPLNDKNNRKDIIRFCIENLMECDAIYLLCNWRESKGAVLEHDIAKELGLKIIFQ